MLSQNQKRLKRAFDILLSLGILPFIGIPLIVLWALATISTKNNGWFVQTRIGQDALPFSLYKLRTLTGKEHRDVHAIYAAETRFGKWLRKTKLDELPQVINVLKGDMSWVGPRPDIPGYADALEGEDRVILSVKPGITGPATLKYRNEDQLLAQQEHPLQYNDRIIWPDKVAINSEYVQHWSFQKDLGYLWKVFF
ncbi:MAG: sugar transferase [Flavobacteriaceae bacterium]